MADVCELAHRRTVRECRRLGVRIEPYNDFEGTEGSYTGKAQEIFDKHYNIICEKTGL